jgi:hypothetical protein
LNTPRQDLSRPAFKLLPVFPLVSKAERRGVEAEG